MTFKITFHAKQIHEISEINRNSKIKKELNLKTLA